MGVVAVPAWLDETGRNGGRTGRGVEKGEGKRREEKKRLLLLAAFSSLAFSPFFSLALPIDHRPLIPHPKGFLSSLRLGTLIADIRLFVVVVVVSSLSSDS